MVDTRTRIHTNAYTPADAHVHRVYPVLSPALILVREGEREEEEEGEGNGRMEMGVVVRRRWEGSMGEVALR